jgi:hypothetical protein
MSIPVADSYRIDCDFPGGNVLIDGIDGDEIRLQPDLRDTEGHWFYWYFRVRGAAGRTLTFRFPEDRRCVGVHGPAVSSDKAASWRWLGMESMQGESFRYQFMADDDEVRFSVGVPYLAADLHEWLARQGPGAAGRHVCLETLCTSEKGRAVERIRLGRLDGHAEHRILLTARHHACEAMASYTLEGMMAAMLAETPVGAWFRNHVECAVIPFVDKDGVEQGDQGKRRRPRDHNRDYEGDSIYAAVRAVRAWVEQWSQGRLHFAMDLHCPYLKDGKRGGTNQYIYLVGSMHEAVWQQQQAFSKLLAAVARGPLPFDPANNLPFGKDWNTGSDPAGGLSCSRWTSQQPGIRLGTSIEIPYADAGGQVVTADSARALGHDLAAAVHAYLASPTK